MAEKPKTKHAAKLEFDPRGYTMQRREAIKKNRQPDEKEVLERELAEYGEVMRQLFRQGFVIWCTVSNDTRRHQDHAKDYRTGERMEAFEANRKAKKREVRHAA